MASSDEKSLAVGHISGFQIDPNFFSGISNPFYAVTFRQDVTELRNYCKERKISFYYGLIYLCCKALQDVPAFACRIRGENVVELGEQKPSFTDLKKGSELFHIVTLPCDGSIIEFCGKAREVSGKGFSVVYDTAGHIFERFEAQKFGRDEAERDVERVLNCDLLILDDLGTEMVTTFVQSALYQIINGRLLEKKSTIVSTNLMPEAIAQRYSGQIASRIEGEYQLLPFVGEDIRVLKKKRGL